MTWLLDTNTIIALFKREPDVWRQVEARDPDACAISSIVAHELYYGAFKSQRRAENLARVDGLRLAVIEFDSDDARASGEVRAMLDLAGTPIGSYDVLIAGQALSRQLTLVTRNLREFERVPGLRLERW
jgi:tRNA(fMet)-specific endonuclease VapC